MMRFKERQKQIELAKQCHEKHIGPTPEKLREARAIKKEKRYTDDNNNN